MKHAPSRAEGIEEKGEEVRARLYKEMNRVFFFMWSENSH
jgi:hypothetical protein